MRNRSFTAPQRAVGNSFTRATRTAAAMLSPTGQAPAPASSVDNWRLDQGLCQADAMLQRHQAHERIIYEPDLEPIDPSTEDKPWPGDLEPEDPSLSSQLRQAEDEEEDEEDMPRDEDGRFVERQDDEEEDEEDQPRAAAKEVDITIVDVDEEIEHEISDEEEPAYQLPQVPA